MIHPERIQRLNSRRARHRAYVLYWMQASQRAECNHALEYAVRQANAVNQPLIVLFGITDHYPEANQRHYAFMLEGLKETQQSLQRRGIQMVIWHRSPEEAALEMADRASLMVTDRGYTRIQTMWRTYVADRASCPLVQVESDCVVPVEVASGKEEYSAATIRRKIRPRANLYMVPLAEGLVKHDSLGMSFGSLNLADIQGGRVKLAVDRSVDRQRFFAGGTSQAKMWLQVFATDKLSSYAERRNDPSLEIQSNLSPYIHFGQISPLYVALRVREATGIPLEAKEAFLEELIVRRELSLNYVWYNKNYDSWKSLPVWARQSLQQHTKDRRTYRYATDELERAATHDPYWNAAMRQMMVTGKMHNYMRMYWGKKVLEWSPDPRQAFETALHLNNKYSLDGRDPNSFAGVAWCFGKHDRPWGERPIFGKVRYMSANGLRRKFDMDEYVRRVDGLYDGDRAEPDV